MPRLTKSAVHAGKELLAFTRYDQDILEGPCRVDVHPSRHHAGTYHGISMHGYETALVGEPFVLLYTRVTKYGM